MIPYDESGKQVEHIDGQYLVSTSANDVYFGDNNKVRMAPIIRKSSGGAVRCFVIEARGKLLASSFETLERVGPYSKFNVNLIA